MFCANCGKEVSNDAKFCINCGYPMQGKVPVAPQSPVLQQDWKKSSSEARRDDFLKSILIIFGIAILFLGLSVFVIWRDKQKDSHSRYEETNSIYDMYDRGAELQKEVSPSMEEARIQSDETKLSEVENYLKIALSIEEIYDAVIDEDGCTVTIEDDDDATVGFCSVRSGIPELDEELESYFSEGINLTSRRYNQTTQTIEVVFNDDWGTFELIPSWEQDE